MKMKTGNQRILEIVKNVSKTHPGGEAFFSAFDAEISKHTGILHDLISMVPKNNFIVLTGGFGKKMSDAIEKGDLPKVPYFLFKGGVRSGNKPELMKIRTFNDSMPMNGVMLDDSIYGGATYKLIKKTFNDFRKLKKCIVVYDGCPVKKREVVSMFRYYDHFKAKPNFSF